MSSTSPPTPPTTSTHALATTGSTLLGGEDAEAVRKHTLQLAHDAVLCGETCIYVCADAPQALAARAADLGFDIAQASRDGAFRLLPLPAALLTDASDAERTEALADVTSVARRRRPTYLIIEDAVPLTGFVHEAWFDAAFATMIDRLAEVGTALILGVSFEERLALQRLRVHVTELASVPTPQPVAQGDGAPYRITPDPTVAAAPPTEAPPVVLETGIEYLDLTVAPVAPKPQRDAFANPSHAPALGRGHYVAADATLPPAANGDHGLAHALLGSTTVEAHSNTAVTPIPVPLDTDLFETVAVEDTLRAFEAHAAPISAPAPAQPAPRLQFVRAFNEALEAYVNEGEPFLALALRMPDGHPAGRRFHFVIGALEHAVLTRGIVLADEKRRRVAVLVPGESADSAQHLFKAVKTRLRNATAEADHVIQTAAAVVVPNGQPFPNATEFLAHVFD